MKSKTLIGLAVVTALVVIGAVAAVTQRQTASERVVTDAAVLPDLMARINDVAALALEGPEADFALRFDGERWVVPDLADFPADFDKVKKTLIGLAELRTIEEKTADPERYGALGLAAPDADEGGGTWVRLHDGDDGTVAALMVGNPGRGGADQVYVRRDGEAETWLARGELDLGDTPNAWVDTMIVRLEPDRVRRVVITHADGETVELARETRDAESFDLVNMPEDATLRSPLTLDNVGRSLAFVRFDDVAAASAGPAPGEGESTAVFETFDGAKVTVTQQKRGEDETWARFEATYDPAAAVPEPAGDGEAEEDEAEAEADTGAAPEETEAAEDEAPFDPAEHTAGIVARTADWAFRIPDFKAEQFGMRMDRLVERPSDEDESGEAGDGPQLVPGALPPGIDLPPGVDPPPVIQLD